MAFVYQVSVEDVETVLLRHSLNAGRAAEIFVEIVAPQSRRIERQARLAADIDQQAKLAIEEVESIMAEAGFVSFRSTSVREIG